MRTASLFRVELCRLFRSRGAWLALALTAASPALGLFFFHAIDPENTTMQGRYLANPALAAGLAGAFVFAVLTLYELDRNSRSRTGVLAEAIVSPLAMALARLAALLCLSLAAALLTVLLWLPATALLVGAVFDPAGYFFAYGVLAFGSLPLAVLAAAAAYQFTGRFDVSLLLFLAFAALSLTVWSSDWQLCWLNPCVWVLSDDFSNNRLLGSVAYMRFTWLLGLGGLWALSYLCVRRYGKGAFSSLARNSRRAYRPALALALLFSCGLVYVGQPFLNHSSYEMDPDFYNIAYQESVFCAEKYSRVTPDPLTGRIAGETTFRLKNTSGQPQTVHFLTNPGYQVSARANGQSVSAYFTGRQDIEDAVLAVELPADQEITLSLAYSGFPQAWSALGSMQGKPEISNSYMVLENSVLAPAPYDILQEGETLPNTTDITLPQHMTAVLFGTGDSQLLEEGDETKTWRFTRDGANMILYAGDYVCSELEAAGMPIRFYYSRKHQKIMEEANVEQAVKAVVEYCTQHYGPLAFYGENGFSLIQTMASGGGYAASGSSTMDELDFTAQNLADTAKGSGGGEVMIHELVHQWWGLGNMFNNAPNDLWSAEGLTSYTTYRIVKELYGEEYARTHYLEQWQKNVEDYYKDFYVRNPEYLQLLPAEQQEAIAGSLATVRQYSEMPLKIWKAEQLLGGEEAMDQVLYRLFNRELDPMNPYLTYEDFLNACGLTEEELELA